MFKKVLRQEKMSEKDLSVAIMRKIAILTKAEKMTSFKETNLRILNRIRISIEAVTEKTKTNTRKTRDSLKVEIKVAKRKQAA